MRAHAAIAVVALLLSAAGCGRRHAAASPQDDARIARAEQHDIDAALPHTPHADLIDSYHIDAAELSIYVPAPQWKALGEPTQDALKRAMWRAWNASIARHGQASGRVFLKVYDLAGNDLGSYFER